MTSIWRKRRVMCVPLASDSWRMSLQRVPSSTPTTPSTYWGILASLMSERAISSVSTWICGWVVRNRSASWVDQSYETLLKLPSSITSSTRTAVVIPAFFHTGWKIANGTMEEQVASVRSRIPFTMSELLSCIRSKQCASSKKGLFTHVWENEVIHD